MSDIKTPVTPIDEERVKNWYPRYSHSDMNDNIRLRLNKAIETTDSEEFVDIAYKLGLFLTEGEDD